MLTCSSQGGLVDLAITLDDINSDVVLVSKGRDVFGTGVPSHFSAMVLKSFNERDGLVRCHVEAVGK